MKNFSLAGFTSKNLMSNIYIEPLVISQKKRRIHLFHSIAFLFKRKIKNFVASCQAFMLMSYLSWHLQKPALRLLFRFRM
ncbi:hypothetical protein BpHYR1_024623 [Brachionus plicatilis]|uniref:Uncharacterized protein n=1 Tax=Brachionus plicatilis TaxID=10195 RepID=A0A3M7SQQ0_BRAPC|nr:hypothetical protein BpHYR1_024623 [Brachionus plicatilis]